MNKILLSLVAALFSGGSLLTIALGLLIANASGTATPTQATAPQAVKVSGPELNSLQQRLFDAVNRYRSGVGSRQLRVDPALQSAAQRRAFSYSKSGINGAHITAGQTPMAAASSAGFHGHGIGENTAQGQPTPEYVVFTTWHLSPGHHRNQVDPTWTRIGVGVVGHTYVTMYGK